MAIHSGKCNVTNNRIRFPFTLLPTTRYVEKEVDRRKKRTIHRRDEKLCQNNISKNGKETEYHDILSEFPSITQPTDIAKTVKHQTRYYIKTSPGPPEACRPRRLAPDRLKTAKAEFDLLMQEGIIRSSKSPWSSPLYMVPKKTQTAQVDSEYIRSIS